jgi:hypothetical protein
LAFRTWAEFIPVFKAKYRRNRIHQTKPLELFLQELEEQIKEFSRAALMPVPEFLPELSSERLDRRRSLTDVILAETVLYVSVCASDALGFVICLVVASGTDCAKSASRPGGEVISKCINLEKAK